MDILDPSRIPTLSFNALVIDELLPKISLIAQVFHLYSSEYSEQYNPIRWSFQARIIPLSCLYFLRRSRRSSGRHVQRPRTHRRVQLESTDQSFSPDILDHRLVHQSCVVFGVQSRGLHSTNCADSLSPFFRSILPCAGRQTTRV